MDARIKMKNYGLWRSQRNYTRWGRQMMGREVESSFNLESIFFLYI